MLLYVVMVVSVLRLIEVFADLLRAGRESGVGPSEEDVDAAVDVGSGGHGGRVLPGESLDELVSAGVVQMELCSLIVVPLGNEEFGDISLFLVDFHLFCVLDNLDVGSSDASSACCKADDVSTLGGWIDFVVAGQYVLPFAGLTG